MLIFTKEGRIYKIQLEVQAIAGDAFVRVSGCNPPVKSAIYSSDWRQFALNFRWVLVDLRGHVTDGKTLFLPLASCHWLVSYCAN